MPRIELDLKGAPAYGHQKSGFYNFDGRNEKDSSRRSQVEVNRENWERLNRERNMSDKPELAAQEHYAYARAEVSEKGIPAFFEHLVLVPTYESLKFILGENRQLLKTGDQEVSPASLDSILKGWEGTWHGLKDYINSQDNEKGSDRPFLTPEKEDLSKDLQNRLMESSRELSNETAGGGSDHSGDHGSGSQDDSDNSGYASEGGLGKMSRSPINNKANLFTR